VPSSRTFEIISKCKLLAERNHELQRLQILRKSFSQYGDQVFRKRVLYALLKLVAARRKQSKHLVDAQKAEEVAMQAPSLVEMIHNSF